MNIPDEEHEKFHSLLDRFNTALAEVYGTDPETMPSIVLGVQPRGMEDGCLVTSNIPVCLVPDAIVDMHTEAIRQHEEVHGDGVSEDGSQVRQRVSLDAVPEEIRQRAIEYAQELGIPVEEIAYVEMVNVSDLRGLPETEEHEG